MRHPIYYYYTVYVHSVLFLLWRLCQFWCVCTVNSGVVTTALSPLTHTVDTITLRGTTDCFTIAMFAAASGCSTGGSSNTYDESKKTYTEFRREELAKDAKEQGKIKAKKEMKILKKKSEEQKSPKIKSKQSLANLPTKKKTSVKTLMWDKLLTLKRRFRKGMLIVKF